MRDVLCDQLRKAYGRDDNHPAVLPLDGGPSDAGPRHEPSSTTLDGEKVQRWTEFHEAAARLPDGLRAVFDLLWYQGLTQAEAAALLGVAVPTVKRLDEGPPAVQQAWAARPSTSRARRIDERHQRPLYGDAGRLPCRPTINSPNGWSGGRAGRRQPPPARTSCQPSVPRPRGPAGCAASQDDARPDHDRPARRRPQRRTRRATASRRSWPGAAWARCGAASTCCWPAAWP